MGKAPDTRRGPGGPASLRNVLAALVVALAGLASPPAWADEAARQAIVAEIFRLMHLDKVLEQSMGNAIVDQIKSEYPHLDPGTEADFREIISEFARELHPEMMLFTGQFMSKHFTEEELKQMLAFHQSDVGRKSIEVLPKMMHEMMIWMPQVIDKAVPRLVEKIKARLKER